MSDTVWKNCPCGRGRFVYGGRCPLCIAESQNNFPAPSANVAQTALRLIAESASWFDRNSGEDHADCIGIAKAALGEGTHWRLTAALTPPESRDEYIARKGLNDKGHVNGCMCGCESAPATGEQELPLPTGPVPSANDLAWMISGMPKVGRTSVDLHVYDGLRAALNAANAEIVALKAELEERRSCANCGDAKHADSNGDPVCGRCTADLYRAELDAARKRAEEAEAKTEEWHRQYQTETSVTLQQKARADVYEKRIAKAMKDVEGWTHVLDCSRSDECDEREPGEDCGACGDDLCPECECGKGAMLRILSGADENESEKP